MVQRGGIISAAGVSCAAATRSGLKSFIVQKLVESPPGRCNGSKRDGRFADEREKKEGSLGAICVDANVPTDSLDVFIVSVKMISRCIRLSLKPAPPFSRQLHSEV